MSDNLKFAERFNAIEMFRYCEQCGQVQFGLSDHRNQWIQYSTVDPACRAGSDRRNCRISDALVLRHLRAV